MIKEISVDQLIKKYKSEFTERQQEIITMAIDSLLFQSKVSQFNMTYVSNDALELDGRFVFKTLSDNKLGKREKIEFMEKELNELLKPFSWQVVTFKGMITDLRFFSAYYYDYKENGNDVVQLRMTKLMRQLINYWLASTTLLQMGATVYITNDGYFDMTKQMNYEQFKSLKADVNRLLADRAAPTNAELRMNGTLSKEFNESAHSKLQVKPSMNALVDAVARHKGLDEQSTVQPKKTLKTTVNRTVKDGDAEAAFNWAKSQRATHQKEAAVKAEAPAAEEKQVVKPAAPKKPVVKAEVQSKVDPKYAFDSELEAEDEAKDFDKYLEEVKQMHSTAETEPAKDSKPTDQHRTIVVNKMEEVEEPVKVEPAETKEKTEKPAKSKKDLKKEAKADKKAEKAKKAEKKKEAKAAKESEKKGGVLGFFSNMLFEEVDD